MYAVEGEIEPKRRQTSPSFNLIFTFKPYDYNCITH